MTLTQWFNQKRMGLDGRIETLSTFLQRDLFWTILIICAIAWWAAIIVACNALFN